MSPLSTRVRSVTKVAMPKVQKYSIAQSVCLDSTNPSKKHELILAKSAARDRLLNPQEQLNVLSALKVGFKNWSEHLRTPATNRCADQDSTQSTHLLVRAQFAHKGIDNH